jgi:hypothetical protein
MGEVMEDSLCQVEKERVGLFEMTVAITEPSPETAERWSRRAETLAGWLLSEWQRERAEGTRQVGGAERAGRGEGNSK